ncbi:hypothetical protein GGH15_004923, partial [Coemansia sp. RSA 562]
AFWSTNMIRPCMTSIVCTRTRWCRATSMRRWMCAGCACQSRCMRHAGGCTASGARRLAGNSPVRSTRPWTAGSPKSSSRTTRPSRTPSTCIRAPGALATPVTH